MKNLFASTASGLEELLKNELQQLGATDCRITLGGVYFSADDKTMYQTLLWSRLASRILLPLGEFTIYSDLDLYACVSNIDWSALFDVDASFMIHFRGTNEFIRNSQYGALKVKDAIVDSFMRKVQQRPNVAKQDPDIRLVVQLHKNQVMVYLDLSGHSLHQRGYRLSAGQAPLKENLAAAIVIRSGWQPNTPLIDPMCGSGTLLIEAAMQAAGIAPGLYRQDWGFKAWKAHNSTLWNELVFAAKAQVKQTKANLTTPFFGYDNDAKVLQIAKQNAQRAGVGELIIFKQQDVLALQNPCPEHQGTLLSNPPYGERLESEPALIALHSALGTLVKQRFAGWHLSLFSGAPQLLDCLQLRADRQYKAKNGALDCVQKNYTMTKRSTSAPGSASAPTSLVAPDFANRLRKNAQKLKKWAKHEGIDCYRLYDADLPEYNVAIDRYQHKVVIQEYAPPKTIDSEKARKRLFDVINATINVLGLSADQVVLKTREKQKGKQQYQKLAQKNDHFLVSEYHAKFWVNLSDYLDTGLFLDHRLARKMIGQMARGQSFLNLFAYTGSATVYAGLGGAKQTTTVDMSRTYLEWADRNLRQNGLTGSQHRLIQADCLHYLQACQEQFDLIFIDPPTFSNSKRMSGTLDIQRDHLLLLKQLKRMLKPNGTIMFSNNKRGFKMDVEGVAKLGLTSQDITAKTISPDFERNKQIHYCFLLTHSNN